MLNAKIINSILGIEEAYKAPDVLMDIMLNESKRESAFKEFLSYETDVTFDWFHEYFQDEQADRKKLSQDFTPESVSKVISAIIPNDYGTRLDVAAGTGGLTITKWNDDRINTGFFKYKPSLFLYQCEEKSDRALPFLIFNLAIRGMNASIVHGDCLSREVKQVYFIQNERDNFLGFSSVNIMPHSFGVEEMFDVREWIEDEIDYIESKDYPDHILGVSK